MKLWQKNTAVDKSIESFTIGRDRELDLFLAPFDILGSLAHAQMLESIDLLTKEDLRLVQKSLKEIYKRTIEGDFEIEEGIEDVHSQVELLLTRELGNVGKKIHSGRSRNDQVLVDLKLYMRSQITSLVHKIEQVFDILQELSETNKDKLIPGYTHMQIAMPSSFGLWFGAYAESLVDDMIQLRAAYEIVNKNPLGSAAGYGSSFPLDREMTTRLLGFETLNFNVVYAQMTRGKAEKVMSNAMASIAGTLAKFSMDVCLYMGQNYGFLTFPDEFTTGSSIMPHKKNPDVFELIRGKCNKLQSLPTELGSILNNLPSGYHRELQVIKESFMPAFETLEDCLSMTKLMLENIIVKDDIVKDPKYDYIFSVEVVNQMVLEGTPFRDAYKKVGLMIESGEYKPLSKVDHSSLGSIGNLANDRIKEEFDKAKKSFGFDKVDKALEGLLS